MTDDPDATGRIDTPLIAEAGFAPRGAVFSVDGDSARESVAELEPEPEPELRAALLDQRAEAARLAEMIEQADQEICEQLARAKDVASSIVKQAQVEADRLIAQARTQARELIDQGRRQGELEVTRAHFEASAVLRRAGRSLGLPKGSAPAPPISEEADRDRRIAALILENADLAHRLRGLNQELLSCLDDPLVAPPASARLTSVRPGAAPPPVRPVAAARPALVPPAATGVRVPSVGLAPLPPKPSPERFSGPLPFPVAKAAAEPVSASPREIKPQVTDDEIEPAIPRALPGMKSADPPGRTLMPSEFGRLPPDSGVLEPWIKPDRPANLGLFRRRKSVTPGHANP